MGSDWVGSMCGWGVPALRHPFRCHACRQAAALIRNPAALPHLPGDVYDLAHCLSQLGAARLSLFQTASALRLPCYCALSWQYAASYIQAQLPSPLLGRRTRRSGAPGLPEGGLWTLGGQKTKFLHRPWQRPRTSALPDLLSLVHEGSRRRAQAVSRLSQTPMTWQRAKILGGSH